MRARLTIFAQLGAPLAALLAVMTAPAVAQDPAREVSPEEAARAAEAAAEAEAEAARLAAQAAGAARDITRLQYALVEAAQARRRSEQDAFEVDARVAALDAREQALLEAIEADRAAMIDVVAALVRIERARPPALLAHGGRALEAARAASVLEHAAPALQTRVDDAYAELTELEQVRAAAVRERAALLQADAEVETRRTEITALIDRRTEELAALRAEAEARAADAQALADRARSLRELIDQLEARAGAFTPRLRPDRPPGHAIPRLRPTPDEAGEAPPPFAPTTGRFADARGRLSLPAAGRITTRFGEPHPSGADRGVGIATRGRAQVTSPFDARIEFAGEYRGYGRLLILSVGDGYHIVLAGLSSIAVTPGQTVLAGEPVGEIVSEAAGGGASLYVEIRRDGQPIDPSPWWRDAG